LLVVLAVRGAQHGAGPVTARGPDRVAGGGSSSNGSASWPGMGLMAQAGMGRWWRELGGFTPPFWAVLPIACCRGWSRAAECEVGLVGSPLYLCHVPWVGGRINNAGELHEVNTFRSW